MRPHQHLVTHQLKPRRQSTQDDKLDSDTKSSGFSSSELLSSISSKLNARSISISTGSRSSNITFESSQSKISCMDQLTIPRLRAPLAFSLEFEDLKRKAVHKKMKNLFNQPTCQPKPNRLCSDPNCPISSRWRNQLVMYEKEMKYAAIVRQRIDQIPIKQRDQIQKDVIRSFPQQSSSKAKIFLYHVHSEKNKSNNIIEVLRNTLKMLVVHDPETSYVQGINLYAANIASHTKDCDFSFAFIKEMMGYGNLRRMYVNNFQQARQQTAQLLHRQLKLSMPQLYEHFMAINIQPQYFLSFYLSLFANVVDFHYIPVVVDQFMTDGLRFLDKLLLSMLCYFKEELLMTEPEELPLHLGSTYIRSQQIPWQEIINVSQAVQLP